MGPAIEHHLCPKFLKAGTSLFRFVLLRFRPPAASSAASCWGFIAERAVPTAAKPAATAASLATRFRVEVLGRTDVFDFVDRLALVVFLLFDLAPARFKLVFDLTRPFDEVLDLRFFFAFFMIRPIQFNLAHIGPQSVCWQAGGDDFLSLIPAEPIWLVRHPTTPSSGPRTGWQRFSRVWSVREAGWLTKQPQIVFIVLELMVHRVVGLRRRRSNLALVVKLSLFLSPL
jgi:hypothetical protein